MADDVVLNAGAGGETIATDQIDGRHYQIVKIALGADGSVGLLGDSTPIPVTLGGATDSMRFTDDLLREMISQLKTMNFHLALLTEAQGLNNG